MLGKEVINDKPLTGEAAQMVREEAKKVLEERNKENITNMTKEEAKHLSELLKAYSEGKTIQWKDKVGNNVWYYMTSNCTMLDIYNKCYRIKPEPKPRPYKNAEEFLKAQKEHGPMILRWENDFRFPTQVKNTGIWVTDFQCNVKYEWLTYEKISRDNITWQDGHPCGILEE